MTPVHEQETHHDVFGPFIVVETVIEDDECARINGGAFISFDFLFHLFEDGFLAFEDVFNNCGVVSVVNEELGNVSGEEAVSGLSSRDHGADGDVLVVEHEVLHKETFTGVTAADEHDDGALVFIRPKADGTHVKFREF